MKTEKTTEITIRELRTFGLLVGGVFALIALWPLLRSQPLRIWAAMISTALIAPAIFMPVLLKMPFRAWSIFGAALGWFNTRLILTVLYFAAILPMALILRLTGKTPLKLHYAPDAESYREPPEEDSENSISNQF